MIKLDTNWITKGSLDFEYKKYILLDYITKVKEKLLSYEIYPYLSDLIEHYRSLKELLNQKETLENKQLIGLDFEKFELVYDDIDDKLFLQLEKIIKFSLHQFGECIMLGKKIYDVIDKEINFFHVGILPNYFDEGYIITITNEINLYSYLMNKVIVNDINYRIVVTRKIETDIDSLLVTPDTIKEKYILPLCNYVPATFTAYIDREISMEGALLPIIKRKIIIFTRDL
tara:strand:+ start:827 stop:1513 length:687 start_codon:yes stop_codon:yes gene_type:complete